MSRQGPEDTLTIECHNQFNLHFKKRLFLHIPNERKTKKVKTRSGGFVSPRGGMLKRMGVKSGVPDILIPEPTDIYPALWVELKTERIKYRNKKREVDKSYPTPNQRRMLVELHRRGHAVAVAWTAYEFIEYCSQYFNNEPVECTYIQGLLKREHHE